MLEGREANERAMLEGEGSMQFKKPKKPNPIVQFFKGCMSSKPKGQPNTKAKRPVGITKIEEQEAKKKPPQSVSEDSDENRV